MHNEVYIFFGPPGSGKGSLSRLCRDNLGWVQLSTGNLCRKHITEQTEIGKKIDFAIKSGKLIPDFIITKIVEDWLLDNIIKENNIILDGYPRTLVQAKAINNLFNLKLVAHKLKIVKLSISDDLLFKRLSGRIICKNSECQAVYSKIEGSPLQPKDLEHCDLCFGDLIKRSDDEELAVKERIAIYNKHEKDLLDFYKKNKNDFLILNVEKSIGDVFEDFRKLINY